MSKPWIHAVSSARRFGGKPEEYLEIHNLMDSSKATIADSRHRALTHNSWFIGTILEKIFGTVFTNSDGKVVSTRDIGEQHVLEDYGQRFIPSAQDFLQEIEFKEWMLCGKGTPPSFAKIAARKTKRTEKGNECNGEISVSEAANESCCRRS
jgi:hypothetical protein